jgi:uncharacterized caspase-like protein
MRNRFPRLLIGLVALLIWPIAAQAENRMALVIGNSAYKTVTALPNPANDARAMTELLRSAGFDVVSEADLSRSGLRHAIREFAAQVALKGPDTVALVYYAGHGLQIEGENYLVPVDAKIEREADVAIEAIRLADIMAALAETPSRTRIVILDACRNNPFSSISKTTGRGLAIVDAPTGSIVSYATAPGMEALDGAADNSPFTAALVAVAKEPNLPIEQALKRVRLEVHKATEGRQTPWESSSLTSDFAFFGSPAAKTASGAAVAARPIGVAARTSKPAGFWRKQLQGRSADDAFEIVILEDDIDAYEEFLALYAKSVLVPRVRGLLERRREMMTWYTAVTVNTVLGYEAFLARYPTSDLAPTARKLRERAKERAQSANLARGMPGIGDGVSSPVAIPASLPVGSGTCACPPTLKRVEPKKPTPPPRGRRPPPVIEEEEVIIRRPPPTVGPGPSIGISIGGVRPRPPKYQPPQTHRPPTHRPTTIQSCRPGMACWQLR